KAKSNLGLPVRAVVEHRHPVDLFAGFHQCGEAVRKTDLWRECVRVDGSECGLLSLSRYSIAEKCMAEVIFKLRLIRRVQIPGRACDDPYALRERKCFHRC